MQKWRLKYTAKEIDQRLAMVQTLDDNKADKENTYTKEETVSTIKEVTKTVREAIELTEENTELEYEYLFESGKEYCFTGGTVKSINFLNLSEENGLDDEYWALLVFPKAEGISEVGELIVNSNIRLLNPDLDLDDYSIVHLLFTFDGLNINCIAAGY